MMRKQIFLLELTEINQLQIIMQIRIKFQKKYLEKKAMINILFL